MGTKQLKLTIVVDYDTDTDEGTLSIKQHNSGLSKEQVVQVLEYVASTLANEEPSETIEPSAPKGTLLS